MGEHRHRIAPYLAAIPRLLAYRLLTAAILAVVTGLLRLVSVLLLSATGHGAITSGDFSFVFTTWQGWLILLVAAVTLMLYLAFDVCGLIILCEDIVCTGPKRMREICVEALRSIRAFLSPHGLFMVVYVAVLAPLTGMGMTLSLTSDFEVPHFIGSVIAETPSLSIAYLLALLVLLWLGVTRLFAIHHVVLGGRSPREAMAASRDEVRAHWRPLIKDYLVFTAKLLLVELLAILVPTLVAVGTSFLLRPEGVVARYLMVLFVLAEGLTLLVTSSLASALGVLKLTAVYDSLRFGGTPVDPPAKAGGTCGAVVLALVVLAVTALVAAPLALDFDEAFPRESSVAVIAHRGGGRLGPENSLTGLLRAAEAGCAGSEIDVQRTADGAYVICHDATFERVAGDERRVSEMTLAEVRELWIVGEREDGVAEEAPVPTLEEMLDASKGRIKLYIELKGETADRRMVDEVVELVRERDMVGEVALISLDYKLMSYAEETYPEFETGLLYFFSFGEPAGLACDLLVLEEMLAGEGPVAAIQLAGKQAIVWTVDEDDAIKRFLCSDVDAIITDEVRAVMEAKGQLLGRSDFERLLDAIVWWAS